VLDVTPWATRAGRSTAQGVRRGVRRPASPGTHRRTPRLRSRWQMSECPALSRSLHQISGGCRSVC